jgi:hypothetical protein
MAETPCPITAEIWAFGRIEQVGGLIQQRHQLGGSHVLKLVDGAQRLLAVGAFPRRQRGQRRPHRRRQLRPWRLGGSLDDRAIGRERHRGRVHAGPVGAGKQRHHAPGAIPGVRTLAPTGLNNGRGSP